MSLGTIHPSCSLTVTPVGAGTKTACPVGTFNPTPRGSLAEHCLACTAGYYCETEALEEETGRSRVTTHALQLTR